MSLLTMLREFAVRSALAGAAIGFIASPAAAHPHEFITVQTEVVFDDAGRVIGMRHAWLLDEFFTAYAVEGADSDGDGAPDREGLTDLMLEILGNIAESGYLTDFRTMSEAPKITSHNPLSVDLKSRRLSLNLEVVFAEPYDASQTPLRYALYEPTYYIAVNHVQGASAVTLDNAPEGCRSSLQEPDPGEDLTAFALALDKTQSAGDGLGVNFAEWVTVTCS